MICQNLKDETSASRQFIIAFNCYGNELGELGDFSIRALYKCRLKYRDMLNNASELA